MTDLTKLNENTEIKKEIGDTILKNVKIHSVTFYLCDMTIIILSRGNITATDPYCLVYWEYLNFKDPSESSSVPLASAEL